MKSSKLAVLAIVAAVFTGALGAQATNDTWEPNNSLAAAKQVIATHYSPNAIWGELFNSPTINDQLILITGDVDVFQSGAPAGTITIYCRQSSVLPATAQIGVELYDAAQTLLAGPASGAPAYRILRTDGTGTSGVPDPYNGVVVSAALGAAGNIFIRFNVAAGAVPAATGMNYEWSMETSTATTVPDASEGNYSNNFLLQTATDATPAGAASPRVTTLNGRTYTGWDYYKVSLPQSGRIAVSLTNFPTVSGTTAINYDIYWLTDQGNCGVLSYDGASDTFPAPNFQFTFPATVSTSEALTTGPLAVGTYYFQVLAWVQIAPATIGFYNNAGDYDISFTCTNVADDVYDIAPNNNDTAATASTLTAGVHNNLKMYFSTNGSEADWFKVNVPNGGTLEVQLTHGAPATDDLNVELYKPNPTTPGAATDRIDFTIIPNNNTAAKGAVTPKEIVGTWGTVGTSGNTGAASGDFLIRVIPGNVPANGTYSLTIYINGLAGATPLVAINIAPDDAREPNDSNAESRANNQTRLLSGLNTGLKSMDGEDWYKVQASNNQPVEITLIYNAAADIDLDLQVFDMNTGAGLLLDVNDGLMDEDLTAQPAGLAKVVVATTAGSAYTAQALTPVPASGDIFIRVLRWGSRGAKYSLNVNINNLSPLTPVQVNSLAITPPKSIDASVSGSITVTVNVSNTAGTGTLNLTQLSLKLTHTQGADVTAEYTISAPTPTLPAALAGGANTNFTFTVTGNPSCTNGQVIISVAAQVGTAKVPGDPTDAFNVVGGVAAVPQLAYTVIRAGGGSNLTAGGVLILEALVNNTLGRATGTFNAPAAIDFSSATVPNLNSQFILSGTASPLPPLTVAVGQTVTVRWTYAISPTAAVGTVNVTFTGGGADNPSSGSGSFVLGGGTGNSPGGGGGCVAADVSDSRLPWGLALVAAMSLLTLGLRRRRAA